MSNLDENLKKAKERPIHALNDTVHWQYKVTNVAAEMLSVWACLDVEEKTKGSTQ